MKYKISIIVPVYNEEHYLERCINSLLCQTIEEYEIILVNDGSTDGSDVIINNFALKDSRIVSVHQVNKGVSAARNNGISISKGEYIGFVDADDWVEADMFEKLYKAAGDNDCDVAVCNYEYEQEGKKHAVDFKIPKSKVLVKEQIVSRVLKYLLSNSEFSSVVNKLYKRSFILENNICFDDDREYAEDFLFNFYTLSAAERLIYINNCGYHYCENLKSTVHRNMPKLFERSAEHYIMCIKLVNMRYPNDGEFKKAIACCFIHTCISAFYYYLILNDNLSFVNKWRIIYKIVNNEHVQEAVRLTEGTEYQSMSRYNEYMVEMVKKRRVSVIIAGILYLRCKSALYCCKTFGILRRCAG